MSVRVQPEHWAMLILNRACINHPSSQVYRRGAVSLWRVFPLEAFHDPMAMGQASGTEESWKTHLENLSLIPYWSQSISCSMTARPSHPKCICLSHPVNWDGPWLRSLMCWNSNTRRWKEISLQQEQSSFCRRVWGVAAQAGVLTSLVQGQVLI